MRLIILLSILFITGCTPGKRLAWLLRKHPELVRTDTIYRRDTTIIDGASADTVFHTQITRDTLIIRDKQLTIKYFNDGKQTFIQGKCDTVIVVKEIPTVVNSIVQRQQSWYEKITGRFGEFSFIIIGIAGLILLVRKILT